MSNTNLDRSSHSSYLRRTSVGQKRIGTLENTVKKEPNLPIDLWSQKSPPRDQKINLISKQTCLDVIKIKKNEEDQDIVWDVWRLGYHFEDNQIVIWEIWLVGVHQKWYKKDLLNSVPKNDWFWERWDHIRKGTKLKKWKYQSWECLFWSSYQGAITNINKNQWAHITCHYEIRKNVIGKPRKNWNQVYEQQNPADICKYWDKRDKGVIISWAQRSWDMTFHIRWGIEKGGLKLEHEDWGSGSKKREIFCKKHFKPILQKRLKEQKTMEMIQNSEDHKRNPYHLVIDLAILSICPTHQQQPF